MLPSDPRAGRSRSVSRQPIQAQSRAPSRPRERYSEEDETRSRGRGQEGAGASMRQVRPQRSMGNMQLSRAANSLPPPPLPKHDYRSRPTRPSGSAYSRPPPSRASDSSASSLTSSGSSLLDRMRQRANGSSSSQSSFELDPEAPKETNDSRKPGLMQDANAITEQEPSGNDLASYGYSIWNRVATAASAWAWTGGSTSNSGMNGVGLSSGDSEVTRALKNYYISKARDISDLPDWLFDEGELRRKTEKMSERPNSDERIQVEAEEAATKARGRGLRDIYESVASSGPELQARGRFTDAGQSHFGTESSVPSSKATNRLKAMRDAKRLVITGGRNAEPAEGRGKESGSERSDAYDRRFEERSLLGRGGRDVMGTAEPAKRLAPARVGLPTNPRRR